MRSAIDLSHRLPHVRGSRRHANWIAASLKASEMRRYALLPLSMCCARDTARSPNAGKRVNASAKSYALVTELRGPGEGFGLDPHQNGRAGGLTPRATPHVRMTFLIFSSGRRTPIGFFAIAQCRPARVCSHSFVHSFIRECSMRSSLLQPYRTLTKQMRGHLQFSVD